MRGVGSKRQTFPPCPPSFGVGELEITVQPSGAVTVKAKDAFRSGCSKQAKTRRASGTSNCV